MGCRKTCHLDAFVELEKLLQLGLHCISSMYYICLYRCIWGLCLLQADSSLPLFERYRGMQLGVANCRSAAADSENNIKQPRFLNDSNYALPSIGKIEMALLQVQKWNF